MQWISGWLHLAKQHAFNHRGQRACRKDERFLQADSVQSLSYHKIVSVRN